MSYDARIARMHDAGVISAEQADRLSRALSERRGGETPVPASRKRPWVATVAIAVVFALAAVGLSQLGGGPEVTEVAQDVREALNQPEEIGTLGNSVQSGVSLALFVIVPVLLVVVWVAWLYNGLVTKEEEVFEAWSQVESNYQRRADLIPNVLEVVADYMAFEKETLGAIVEQRSEAQAALPSDVAEQLREMIDAVGTAQEESSGALDDIRRAPVDDETLERLSEAQSALGVSMHRILALSENYPQLRSSDQVLTLQAELEGTENRINVARMRFNEAASEFNSAIRRMPASLIASAGGFRRKAYFTSDPGADRPVETSLD